MDLDAAATLGLETQTAALAAELHEEFDHQLGAAAVDAAIAAERSAYADAQIHAFVPLLVYRDARERLRRSLVQPTLPSYGTTAADPPT